MRTPDIAYLDDRVVPWIDAHVHVWSEAVTHGATVFEGLRAFWARDERVHYVLALDRHLLRLAQSARLLRFPSPPSQERVRRAVTTLVGSLDPGHDLYVRPTLFVDRDERGASRTRVFVVAFPPAGDAFHDTGGLRMVVSGWRRESERTLPPRIKTGAAYQALRLAARDAELAGADGAILLNDHDQVAEATDAAVFVMCGDQLLTPPLATGILESITRLHVMEIAAEELRREVREQTLARSDLYVAREVFLAGTLRGVRGVVEIDGRPIGDGAIGPVTTAIGRAFRQRATAGRRAPAGWLTRVGRSARR